MGRSRKPPLPKSTDKRTPHLMVRTWVYVLCYRLYNHYTAQTNPNTPNRKISSTNWKPTGEKPQRESTHTSRNGSSSPSWFRKQTKLRQSAEGGPMARTSLGTGCNQKDAVVRADINKTPPTSAHLPVRGPRYVVSLRGEGFLLALRNIEFSGCKRYWSIKK